MFINRRKRRAVLHRVASQRMRHIVNQALVYASPAEWNRDTRSEAHSFLLALSHSFILF